MSRIQVVDENGQPKQYSITEYSNAVQEFTPALKQEVSWASTALFEGYNFRPYNPDALYQQKGNYDLYDDIRQDDQVYAALSLKKHIILNSGWKIECEDEDVVKFITSCLNVYLDDTFENKLKEILTALDYGFSVTEKVADIVETPEGPKMVFTKLLTRAPHSWEIRTDDKGAITELVQYTGGQDQKIPLDKVILYSYQKEFDNFYGQSDINKGVYTAWWSKTNIIKFWNIALEKYAMPTAIGKIPAARANIKDDILKVLKNIQSRTAMTIPDEVMVEFLEMKGNGFDAYEKAINKYDTMIARKLLIPDLMGLSGSETGGGSYALGKEQFDLFYSVIRSIRQDIERIVNRHIVNQLVFWNFGNKVDAHFRFAPIDEEQKEKDLTRWTEAIKTGKIPVTNESINWFLDKVNAPEISKEELEKIEEEKQAFKDQLANNGNQEENTQNVPNNKENPKSSKPEPPKEKPKNDKPPGQTEEDKKEMQKEFSKYYRELTVFEKRRVDFNKVEKKEAEIQEKYNQLLNEAYRLIINGVMNDIRKKRIIQKKKLEQVNSVKLRNVNQTTKLYKDMIKDAYNFGTSTVNRKKFNLDNEDIAKWIEEEAIRISGVESEEILKKVKAVLAEGIRKGYGTQQTSELLEEALKPWNLGISGSRIEMITRTETAKAFNQARTQQFAELREEGEISAFQFSAILDGRTSDICTQLDGKILLPQQLEYFQPPLHPNCRSLIVPIFEDEEFGSFSNMPPTEPRTGGGLQLVRPKK